MTIPKMTRGRLIALGILAATLLGLAALGGAEFWSIIANMTSE